jgi:hypothetical protein
MRDVIAAGDSLKFRLLNESSQGVKPPLRSQTLRHRGGAAGHACREHSNSLETRSVYRRPRSIGPPSTSASRAVRRPTRHGGRPRRSSSNASATPLASRGASRRPARPGRSARNYTSCTSMCSAPRAGAASTPPGSSRPIRQTPTAQGRKEDAWMRLCVSVYSMGSETPLLVSRWRQASESYLVCSLACISHPIEHYLDTRAASYWECQYTKARRIGALSARRRRSVAVCERVTTGTGRIII